MSKTVVTVGDGGVTTVTATVTRTTVVGVQGPEGAQGPTGATGATGAQGPQGDPGEGVPPGGSTGQLLRKATATDFDTEWVDPPSGTGDVVGPGSATAGNLVSFDGATGKLVQDAGVSASSFATAGQGSLADSAVQPGDLAAVATSGAYSDLSGAPSLATVATSGAYSDLSGTPSLGTAAALDVPSSGDAASGEVVKGDDSRLSDARTPTAHTHDDRYYTEAEVDSALGGKANASHSHAISDVTNLQSALDGKTDTGHTHTLSDITDAGTAAAAATGDFATAAQGALADTAVQPGDLATVATSGGADDVSYDNTTSGLTATDVQAAVDELAAAGGGAPDWGDIGGTLADQTDLQAALDAKLAKLATINSFAGNHTLDSSDSGAYVRITAAGTVTLPDGLSTGFQCVIVNATDAATVALSAATTLTIPSGFDAEVVNRRAVTVIHVGSDAWEAHGALVESA